MKDQKLKRQKFKAKTQKKWFWKKNIQYSPPSLHPQTSEISMGSTCYFWKQFSPEALDKQLSGTREVIHYHQYTFVANL